MEASCSYAASLPQTLPLYLKNELNSRKIGANCPKIRSRRREKSKFRVFATRQDEEYPKFRGRLVDANMIVLRKRIHELEMAEQNYRAPESGMEWEKQYYVSYDSDICQGLGLLQGLLMKTRPGVAIGVVALLLLSLPLATLMILGHLVQMGWDIFNGY
ncbi:hypothetical protein AMTRI_Chr13g118900 [Amborella trichopoda]|uniref:Uncharacterized protein n=1 Tax=Amborella trichopoda TaxID=13333 RepID=W1NXI4_AMBTC|nr:uncharacterized protein LOC18428096 [Amborella trichopoda]ERN00054.1 hypothetical protein AMTR_s00105p00083010 [Amborella trichopoda]|eukprot:XP_006837200.1 uncharacterized protein LOC18428096 [Amborella trichopoda]